MVTPGVSPRPPRALRWVAVGQALLWGAIGLGAFLLLAKSVQNSSEFGRLQPWILLVNIAGVIALSVLLARKLWQLVRDYRAHVPGSRLTARTVAIFGSLVIAPLLIVYLFSLRVPQPRHRQLVHGRGEAGPERRAGAVARRARPAHARVLGAHRAARRHARATLAPADLQARARRRAARQPGARDRAVRRARAHPRGEPREPAREPAVAPAARPAAPGGAAPAVRQPRAAGGRPLPDPHRRGARRCSGGATGASWSRCTRCRRSSRRCPRRCRAPTRSTATWRRCASR